MLGEADRPYEQEQEDYDAWMKRMEALTETRPGRGFQVDWDANVSRIPTWNHNPDSPVIPDLATAFRLWEDEQDAWLDEERPKRDWRSL